MGVFWKVIHSGHPDGILARVGCDSKSMELSDRLAKGAVVEQLELNGERLNFKLVKGSGPESGWVSTKVKNTALLRRSDESGKKLAAPEETGGAPADAAAMIEARCAKELSKPALEWQFITNATVIENHMKKAKGMAYQMEFPWSAETLEQMGPEWLTEAFHKVGSMPKDNKVTKIILENKIKITTGNNGGKFLFEVEYQKADPDLHTKLFAKCPFAFGGATKSDRLSSSVNKQPAELYEVNAYRIFESRLPMKTPRFYFGDISNETSNWIIITERIDFYDFNGNNFGPPAPTRPPQLPAFQIEGPYDKCIDHNLRGDPKEYYMLLTKVGAKMAGLSKSGKLGSQELILKSFSAPPDSSNVFAWGMNPGAATGPPPKQHQAVLTNAINFITGHGKVVFPDWVCTDAFKKKLKDTLLKASAYTTELNYWLHMNADYVALGHQNLNVDNAYFWRDEDGNLDCGVFDWGGAGSASSGRQLWWWYYCMDYPVFKENIRDFLACYVDTYAEYSGLQLDKDLLYHMVLISGIIQMQGLVSAVPQIAKMCPKKEWETIKDRYDPRIGLNVDDKSTIRLYLHCMNTIMAIIEEMKGDELMDKWIKDVYCGTMQQTAKTDEMIGLA